MSENPYKNFYRNFYEIMQIPIWATQEEIDWAYNYLIWTRSENVGTPYDSLRDAYKVLGNPEERKLYDAEFPNNMKNSGKQASWKSLAGKGNEEVESAIRDIKNYGEALKSYLSAGYDTKVISEFSDKAGFDEKYGLLDKLYDKRTIVSNALSRIAKRKIFFRDGIITNIGAVHDKQKEVLKSFNILQLTPFDQDTIKERAAELRSFWGNEQWKEDFRTKARFEGPQEYAVSGDMERPKEMPAAKAFQSAAEKTDDKLASVLIDKRAQIVELVNNLPEEDLDKWLAMLQGGKVPEPAQVQAVAPLPQNLSDVEKFKAILEKMTDEQWQAFRNHTITHWKTKEEAINALANGDNMIKNMEGYSKRMLEYFNRPAVQKLFGDLLRNR